jgi:hypothetical protein
MIGLIKSDKFCRELTPIINIRYLTTDYHKILFSWIKEFFDEFKESPKKDIIKIYRVKAEQITDDVLLDNLLKFIENVCQNYDKHFNEDFVLKESINYLKKQSLTNLNLDLDSYLSTGQIDKAEMRLLSYKSLEKASGKSISMFDKVSVMNAFSDENDVLFKMKSEKKWHMEEKEPLCHKYDKKIMEKESELSTCKVGSKKYKDIKKELDKLVEKQAPREGVVIRIDNDIFPRAWKLKTAKHYELSKKAHDKGEIDMEEMDGVDINDIE